MLPQTFTHFLTHYPTQGGVVSFLVRPWCSKKYPNLVQIRSTVLRSRHSLLRITAQVSGHDSRPSLSSARQCLEGPCRFMLPPSPPAGDPRNTLAPSLRQNVGVQVSCYLAPDIPCNWRRAKRSLVWHGRHLPIHVV